MYVCICVCVCVCVYLINRKKIEEGQSINQSINQYGKEQKVYYKNRYHFLLLLSVRLLEGLQALF